MDINLPMSPPVNNSLQGNLYDKLDAISFEKTRVMNCLLDSRRCLQEKIINKHRRDAQRTHETQSKRLRQEVKKINEKKPDYVYDDTDLTMSRSREGHERNMKQRSNSVPALCGKGGHCKRYYQHHYHVKYEQDDKHKKDKQIPREKTDFFNLKLKLFFYNTMANIYKTQQRMKEESGNTQDEYHTHEEINLPNISESKEPHVGDKDIEPFDDDDVFPSPRDSEKGADYANQSHNKLQNSTTSLWSKDSAMTEDGTGKHDDEWRGKRFRKRDSRTLRLYGSDTVLNHVHKKRESCDEKEFAKKREQWLQSRHSSEKMFSALT